MKQVWLFGILVNVLAKVEEDFKAVEVPYLMRVSFCERLEKDFD